MDQLSELIQQYFPPKLRQDLVSTYQSVYRINMAAHNEEEGGHDAQSFGTLNWKSRCFLLKKLDDPANGIVAIKRGRYFSLGVGPFEVVPYNAGKSTDRDYANAFPNNGKGAIRAVFENVQQLKLPLGMDGYDNGIVDDAECRKLILCDMGDCYFGLSALFLGVPIKSSKNKIAGWSRFEVIWQRDSKELQLPAVPITVERPPVEVVAKPQIRLKTPKSAAQ